MFIKLKSSLNYGIEAKLIDVEIDVSPGLPAFTIVGLVGKSVVEAQERVKAAIKNTGGSVPAKRITVNLAPAELPKDSSHYDLAIALGLISLNGTIDLEALKDFLILGELSLDGNVKPVSGIVSACILAKEAGVKHLILPKENKKEANLVSGLEILFAENLLELIDQINKPDFFITDGQFERTRFKDFIDFSEIKGHDIAKRALLISASGGHNCLFAGPPGSGKTLLSKAMAGILPDLNQEEIVEVTKIYSLAGLLNEDVLTQRPFRSPHHTISYTAMVGGGKIPKPGEITLSHLGVLFLDELPEFSKMTLEALRQPLEDKLLTISRASGSLTFPASFTLISSMNPCPCGFYGDKEKVCTCSPFSIEKYKKKISGPLIDRIDIQIDVPRVSAEKIIEKNVQYEPSKNYKDKVIIAREIQESRFKEDPIRLNSEMSARDVNKYIILDEESESFLKTAAGKLNLSGRAIHRILKTSRTIADLEMSENLKLNHIAESLQLRIKA